MSALMMAKDVMRKEVISVPRRLSVWEVAELFSVKGISGAPVVDENGDLVGVVSQTDIIRHLEDVTGAASGADDFYAESEYGVSKPVLRLVTAGDIMSPKVICASEETSIDSLSHIMLANGIHRIIITREKKIVGIVTTMDLLKVL